MASPRAAADQPPPSSRLSVSDWIEAGFAVMAEEGVKAVKIDRLCGRLGVTKGSFYWHFTDLQAYHDAVAASWGEARDAVRREWAEIEDVEPRERLSRMLTSLTDARQWMLERAVREWGRSDPKVAEKVRASDRWVYRAVLQTFLDAGFAKADAETRARAMFYAGVGLIHVSDGRPSARAAREREQFLDLLMPR